MLSVYLPLIYDQPSHHQIYENVPSVYVLPFSSMLSSTLPQTPQNTGGSQSVIEGFSLTLKQTNHNDPKYLDRQVWANSVDLYQTEQSDHSLHCLPLHLHLLDILLYDKTTLFKFQEYYNNFGCPILQSFTLRFIFICKPVSLSLTNMNGIYAFLKQIFKEKIFACIT